MEWANGWDFFDGCCMVEAEGGAGGDGVGD